MIFEEDFVDEEYTIGAKGKKYKKFKFYVYKFNLKIYDKSYWRSYRMF